LEKASFAEKLIFGDQATFDIHGMLKRDNIRICGTENPHATIQHILYCPELKVFCAISNKKCTDHFSSPLSTFTGTSYLDTKREWLKPQVENDSDDFTYRQDGAPPHYQHLARGYLNQRFPQCCIGRMTAKDLALLRWPPKSPDLTPCDFSSEDILKTMSFYRFCHKICQSCEDS
jgi:hypothetical protein